MIPEAVIGIGVVFALLATRMAAFMAVSPIPGTWVPAQVRIGFSLLLALVAFPAAGQLRQPAEQLALTGAFGEVIVGVTIGFVFRVGVMAADVVGSSLAQAMGLTFAAAYDPARSETSDPLSRIVTLLALVLAIQVGAHRIVIGSLLASVQAVPVGSVPDMAAMTPELLRWFARSVESGVALALPASAACLVVQLGLALVSRAAPSLQIFNVGLAISVATGVLVLMQGADDLMAGLAAHFGRVRPAIEAVLTEGHLR